LQHAFSIVTKSSLVERDIDLLAPLAARRLVAVYWAELLRQRVDKACARLGLSRRRIELDLTRFRPPGRHAGQGELF
jgi:DNA repair photolyase